MTDSAFDPGAFFEFDLARGDVRARGGERVVLLSESALAPLVAAAVKGGDLTAVRKLGRHLGQTAASGLASVADSPPEVVIGRAADVLALFGWGRLTLDRWGDALAARVDGLPRLDEAHLGIAALLGGIFSALADRDVACVPVSKDGLFLLVDPSIAHQVWKWARAGDGVPAIVARLAAPEAA